MAPERPGERSAAGGGAESNITGAVMLVILVMLVMLVMLGEVSEYSLPPLRILSPGIASPGHLLLYSLAR